MLAKCEICQEQLNVKSKIENHLLKDHGILDKSLMTIEGGD